MRKIVSRVSTLVIGSFLAITTLHAQPIPHAKDVKETDVVFTIAGQPVTIQEFKYIYEKNNSVDKSLYSDSNLSNYLKLYVNFKLKVKAAKDAGMDTAAAFQKEFNKYRGQLAQPYLSDREVSKALIDEGYERMKTELRVSHLLLRVEPNAKPSDTLKVWNRMDSIRKAITRNALTFDDAARKFSQDNSAAANGGDIGYFTAFNTVYPFETEAYKLKDINQVSSIVRTQFGYHLVKLTDRRPYRGEVKIKHIMIYTSTSDSAAKQKVAKSKIDSVYSMLTIGQPFTELARMYSEHEPSKASGGELQKFNSFASFPAEFKDAAFGLSKPGQYTKPFLTEYGWHIIYLDEKIPLGTRAALEEQLKNSVSRDSRSTKSQAAAIAKFKKEYKFAEKKSALKPFYKKYADTSLLSGRYTAQALNGKKDKAIFSMDGKEFGQKSFSEYLVKRQEPGRYFDLKQAIDGYYEAWVNETVLNTYDKQLESKFPEFANISREYYEGLLLFDIQDKYVWSKSMTDTIGQKAFFERNRSKYVWKDRVDAILFDFVNESDRKEISMTLSEIIRAYQLRCSPLLPVFTTSSTRRPNQRPARGARATIPAASKPLQANWKSYDELVTAGNKDQILFAKIRETDYVNDTFRRVERRKLDTLTAIKQKVDPFGFNYKAALIEKGESEYVDQLYFNAGVKQKSNTTTWYYPQNPVKIGNRFYVLAVKRFLPSQNKTLDEVRGTVIAQYQEELEARWIAELRVKYPVVINDSIVKKITKP